MRPYPRLSDEPYSDDLLHTEEVIETITEIVADAWRYYKSKTLTAEQQQQLQEVISSFVRNLPPPVKELPHKTFEGKLLKPINANPKKKVPYRKGMCYTIEVHPFDFPEHVVIRGWISAWSHGIQAKCKTIEEARAMIPEGLEQVKHHDPVMVESWM